MKKWATTTAAMGLALATSLASTSATMLKLKQTMMAAERNRIQFNEYEVKPEAHYLLGDKAMADTSDLIQCTTTNSKTVNSGNATIMIAISKCVSDANLAMINEWVDSIKNEHATYIDEDGKIKDLAFTTTLLPDDCEQRSERASRGYNDTSGYNSQTLLSDGTDYTQYADVLPQEVERIQAFARFGRVLPAVADDKVPPVAVVSFVNNERSYDYIEQYEGKHNISKTFNFQLCQNGTACGGNFENCIKLEENIDLFMYNPFQIVHSTKCLSLEGGIPVTYLDEHQAHKCYCKCPAGYEMDAYKTACKPIESACDCVWQQSSPSLRIDNTEKLGTCLFKNLSSCWHMAVPFPLDNYVSDYRNNSEDGTNNVADGPHVDLIVTPLSGTVFDRSVLQSTYENNHQGKAFVMDHILETKKAEMIKKVMENGNVAEPASEPYEANGGPQAEAYEWKDYQRNRGAKIDSIGLTTYGKFQLELKASDYFDSATCLGCVEVVDKFRPQNTTQCPLRVCDNSTSLCATSAAGVVEVAATPEFAKLKDLVDAVYEYRDKATNDACSAKTEDRCDENTFSVKSWLQKDYETNTNFDAGKTCLSESELKATFTASSEAKVNPLIVDGKATKDDNPVEAFHCKRCCKYGVQLKEWWVDYKCGYDYDVKSCDGDAPHCDFEQCVALNGDSLASAKAHIKDDVQTESKNVLASLGVDGFQTYTQVHYALPCTDFNAACNYTVSVTDLFEKSASLKFTDGDADSYVYWRYKIHDEDAAWQLWESATAYSFTKPATQITIEAWTACGRVRQFYFYVHLHAHSDIKVCDYFKGMWYQSTVSHLDASDTAALCAYPGSDFAELTFDYQANIGLQYAYDRLRMNVTGVQCDLAFKDKAATQILDVTGTSMDIIERYAVELQNLERTQKYTSFSVICTFTYKQYGTSTLTHSCDRAFTIKDCDPPTIDTPDAECLWDDCAGQGKPGPYEVCSGNMVSSTATATYMKTTEVECCQGCEKKTECASILDLPVGRDIKRCVPPTTRGVYGEYGYEDYGDSTYTAGAYIASTPSLLAKAAASHPTAAAATVLLVASALVALVALVVVRQRRAAAAEAMIVEDAYYPLLH